MQYTTELTVAELVQRWQEGTIPETARVRVSFETKEPVDNSATLALFDQWAEEDANMTPEEIAAERQLSEQLYHNTNQTRRELGMREI